MSEEFVQEYKSKLNCCDFNKEIIQCENENIVTLKFEYDNYNERNIKDIFNVLSNLQQLKSLEISKSNINQLPTEFSNLTNLETLKIEGSVLNEFPNVFNMASIKKLYLNGNNFYGYVPIELLELENLKIITLNGNPNLKGYVPPFPNLDRCDFHKTGLCTLKGEKCKAPIQCRKDEIEDGNKNNGNLVPNAYEDKAISKDSEREVKGDTLEYVSSWNVFQKGKYYIKLILEILVMIILTIIGLYIMMWKLKVCGPFYKLLCCLTILSNK
ncbi:L domain-like protein [Neocallimastix lanati (nom. inval.)]|nr:L domain-like protein [Neocallimastix sp. JGI-2020a]